MAATLAFISPIPCHPSHHSHYLPCSTTTIHTAPLLPTTTKRTRSRSSRPPLLFASATTDNASNTTSVNRTADIRLMACDMDGTLLTTDKKISSENEQTIMRLMNETEVIFIPATGKSRVGALRSVGPLISERLMNKYPNGVPGVYLQGLLVFNLQGEIIYERTVSTDIVKQCSEISKQLNIDLIAYCRDKIVCEKTSSFTDLLPTYHEPQPEIIKDWISFSNKNPLNKLIFMADPHIINQIRPGIQNILGHLANLTQAQDNMLEILPKNTNKGFGVLELLDHLNLSTDQVLAIGDAENDIELLQSVQFSCCVDNALPSVKKIAKYSNFGTNDQNGVSNAILQFLL